MNVPQQLTLRLHLALYSAIVLSFFFQALTWGLAHRFFAYFVLLLVAGIYFQAPEKNKSRRRIILKSLLPLAIFVILEWIATLHFPWDVKETRRVLLATGLTLGIVLMAREHKRIRPYIASTLTVAIYAYAVLQIIWVYGLGQNYGTTKNPHYLAIYSAIFLVVAIFLAVNWSRGIQRYCLLVAAAVLGALLLNTSSRPTWISLMTATFIVVICLRNRAKLIISLLTSLVLVVLLFTDAGNFKTRIDDLVVNASAEERVTIWMDTWVMQQDSNCLQWLIGHGVESFEEDFQLYSRYYLTNGVVFNSPHNALLEVLYQFGWVGLVVLISFMLWLYYALFARYFQACKLLMHQMQMVLLLLITLLTVTLITVSITLPFFVSIHLNIIALVLGVLYYLDRLEQR